MESASAVYMSLHSGEDAIRVNETNTDLSGLLASSLMFAEMYNIIGAAPSLAQVGTTGHTHRG